MLLLYPLKGREAKITSESKFSNSKGEMKKRQFEKETANSPNLAETSQSQSQVVSTCSRSSLSWSHVYVVPHCALFSENVRATMLEFTEHELKGHSFPGSSSERSAPLSTFKITKVPKVPCESVP